MARELGRISAGSAAKQIWLDRTNREFPRERTIRLQELKVGVNRNAGKSTSRCRDSSLDRDRFGGGSRPSGAIAQWKLLASLNSPLSNKSMQETHNVCAEQCCYSLARTSPVIYLQRFVQFQMKFHFNKLPACFCAPTPVLCKVADVLDSTLPQLSDLNASCAGSRRFRRRT